MRARRSAEFLLLDPPSPAHEAFLWLPKGSTRSSLLASSFDAQVSGAWPGASLTTALLVGGLAAGTALLVASRPREVGPEPEPAWVARRAELQAELEVAGDQKSSGSRVKIYSKSAFSMLLNAVGRCLKREYLECGRR